MYKGLYVFNTMNKLFNLKQCEKRLLICFLLHKRICYDLIRSICDICYMNDSFFFIMKNNIIQEIKSLSRSIITSEDNYEIRPSEDNYEIRPSLKINNFIIERNYPILYNHSDICGCKLCLNYYDNYRYRYLYYKYHSPYKGSNSRLINKWIKFQFYLSTTKRWSKDIQGIDDIYGFTSIYDKNNNYRISSNRYNTSHIILKDNKGYNIQIQDIWNKINN